MGNMDRLVDKAVLLFACFACMAGAGLPAAGRPGALEVGVVLAGIAASALFEAVPSKVRWVLACLSPLAVLFAPTGLFVLPLALYDAARDIHRGGIARFVFAVPLAAFACVCALGEVGLPSALACSALFALGLLLSVRTSRMSARFEVLNRMRDDLASKARQLGFRAEALESELEAARGRSLGDPRPPMAGDDLRPAAFRVLTDREFEVARLVADGMENREIAAAAFMSEGTVRNHISSILAKMGLKNRTQIAIEYWRDIGRV